MSKLIASLIAGLFATSIAFAAITPAPDVKVPEAKPAATAPTGAKKKAHKHVKKVKVEEKAAQTK
jgi:hypothetical protein